MKITIATFYDYQGGHFVDYDTDEMTQEEKNQLARDLFDFGEKTKLRDACEYALMSGGKRFRPLIVTLAA